MQDNTPTNAQSQPVISAYVENGEKLVRIVAGKYDILLDIKDLCDNVINWHDAMQLAQKSDRQLPAKEMWSLIGAFLPEINSVIEQLDGDILDAWYWARDEFYNVGAWVFSAETGSIGSYSKSYGSRVRGCRVTSL